MGFAEGVDDEASDASVVERKSITSNTLSVKVAYASNESMASDSFLPRYIKPASSALSNTSQSIRSMAFDTRC